MILKNHYEEYVALNKFEYLLDKIDWDGWIKTTGYPIMNFEFKSAFIDQATSLVDNLIKGKLNEEFFDIFLKWHTSVKVVFLNKLKERINEISDVCYEYLRDKFKLHFNYNTEVTYLWYVIALKLKKSDVVSYVEKFLESNGRMKYLRPIYSEYYNFNNNCAIELFQKNK